MSKIRSWIAQLIQPAAVAENAGVQAVGFSEARDFCCTNQVYFLPMADIELSKESTLHFCDQGGRAHGVQSAH